MFGPPFIVTDEQIDQMVGIAREAIDAAVASV